MEQGEKKRWFGPKRFGFGVGPRRWASLLLFIVPVILLMVIVLLLGR